MNRALIIRYSIIVFMILLTSILIKNSNDEIYSYTNKGINNISKIPLNIIPWEGKDVFLEERTYRILETDSIIHRDYSTSQGGKIFLSIVHYPEIKVDFHSPEACLGGLGIKVSKTKKEKIAINHDQKQYFIEVNQFIHQGDNEKSLFFYFYKTGQFAGPSYIKLRLHLALNRFREASKSGSLIRVSTPIHNNHINESSERISEFINLIYPYINEYL